MNFPSLIQQICVTALKRAYPSHGVHFIQHDLESEIVITEATQPQFGHYQCNSAMKLSKLLGEKPRDIAEKLAAEIKNEHLFQKIEIAGPGFINFWLNPEYLSNAINKQLIDPRCGVLKAAHPLKVVIDYSSPNIAKEMHVGHLRSTVIGDCLARILRFLGHTVLGLNHVGDWGTQFGMLIAYIKRILPESIKTQSVNATLSELVQWYKSSKELFDKDPDFKKQSQQEVVALQSGNPLSLKIWEDICEISRKAYADIYFLLGIEDLTERGESFYSLHLPNIINEFTNKNLMTISEGAKCVYLDGFVNRDGEKLPLIIQKSDGGYNYATTDLAALKHRVQDEKANWLIYVTDAGQSQHLQMVFEAAQKIGYYSPVSVKISHVPFGLVLGPDGKKFKTRSGETEKLIDLLQTAVDKAKAILQERNKDDSFEEIEQSALILGINAIKYADLSCNRISDYSFSYDKMLKFEGNTATFLLYAYVRIQSIQRKINSVDSDFLIKKGESIKLITPEEISLGLHVLQFSEVIENTVRELMPSRLTDYLFHLAEKFHLFFHQCRVEGSSEQNSRLLLCKAVSSVLRQGILLLGLKPLERM